MSMKLPTFILLIVTKIGGRKNVAAYRGGSFGRGDGANAGAVGGVR